MPLELFLLRYVLPLGRLDLLQMFLFERLEFFGMLALKGLVLLIILSFNALPLRAGAFIRRSLLTLSFERLYLACMLTLEGFELLRVRALGLLLL